MTNNSLGLLVCGQAFKWSVRCGVSWAKSEVVINYLTTLHDIETTNGGSKNEVLMYKFSKAMFILGLAHEWTGLR